MTHDDSIPSVFHVLYSLRLHLQAYSHGFYLATEFDLRTVPFGSFRRIASVQSSINVLPPSTTMASLAATQNIVLVFPASVRCCRLIHLKTLGEFNDTKGNDFESGLLI